MALWNTDNPKVGNAIAADIPDIEENFQELHDVIEAITNGTLGTTEPANFKVDAISHVKDLYLFSGLSAGDAAETNLEYTTLASYLRYESFQLNDRETWAVVMPLDWNVGTVKAKFYWIVAGADAAAVGRNVNWQIRGASMTDSDAVDVAANFGTAVAVEDTVLGGTSAATTDMHVTAATAAMTIGGSPAAGHLVLFEVSRIAVAGTELDTNAGLVLTVIQYTANVTPAAWA